jgi:hypothetical protein
VAKPANQAWPMGRECRPGWATDQRRGALPVVQRAMPAEAGALPTRAPTDQGPPSPEILGEEAGHTRWGPRLPAGGSLGRSNPVACTPCRCPQTPRGDGARGKTAEQLRRMLFESAGAPFRLRSAPPRGAL